LTDIVSPRKRSEMMAGIRAKNTKPEMFVRKALHARGFRFRLHNKKLPGKPDLVLPKYRAVIFVHGCFWHGHDCNLFRLPSTRRDWWLNKINANRARDSRVESELAKLGWRWAIVWECALRGKFRLETGDVTEALAVWLFGSMENLELKGNPDD
jgi:DNA mismatch endonuclease, patch repair protein|tara:strand:+ start:1064 stop:1525 length:462 start_codon:yes stop_codon:yes gene_type:complete